MKKVVFIDKWVVISELLGDNIDNLRFIYGNYKINIRDNRNFIE